LARFLIWSLSISEPTMVVALPWNHKSYISFSVATVIFIVGYNSEIVMCVWGLNLCVRATEPTDGLSNLVTMVGEHVTTQRYFTLSNYATGYTDISVKYFVIFLSLL
jgi:hypothetical protein